MEPRKLEKMNTNLTCLVSAVILSFILLRNQCETWCLTMLRVEHEVLLLQEKCMGGRPKPCIYLHLSPNSLSIFKVQITD